MKIETGVTTSLGKNGFALVEIVLNAEEVSGITDSIEEHRKSKSGKLPGLRNLLLIVPL